MPTIKPGKKSDIFALGILLLELCYGERPMGESKAAEYMLYKD